jgi:hypothetical protein
MRRAADEIIVPSPSDKQRRQVWAHFGSRCAYCGQQLDFLAREGHLDHADHDGGNHLGNFVLACGPCNGDEKRERPWRDFLDRKVDDPVLRAERFARIEAWMSANPAPPSVHNCDVEAIRAKIDVLADEYTRVCNELRAAVQRARS